MFNTKTASFSYLTGALLIVMSLFGTAHAEEKMEEPGGVLVSDAWARATFPTAKAGAGYLTLTNSSEQEVVLLSASVSADVASMVELHETVMSDDMMKMQELEEGIVIAAGETVEFKPGGKHIMFMGLTNGLAVDENFDVQLTFADAAVMNVNFIVKDAR